MGPKAHRGLAEIRDNGEPDLMRTHTMTTLYRKDLGAPEDFTESRSIVCMIDRVCCVMYRCNYELLISPYNLFHPTTKTHYNPGVCSALAADCGAKSYSRSANAAASRSRCYAALAARTSGARACLPAPFPWSSAISSSDILGTRGS